MRIPASANRLRLLTLVGAVVVLSGLRTDAVETKPPNIVLIISDDQAWTDYGFMGHPVIRTPHLDRLASQSAVFRRGYVPTALCRPSLATLLTGHYAHRHGITGNDPSPLLAPRGSKKSNALRAKLIANIDRHATVPKLLSDVGYVSHQSGKYWEGNYRRAGLTHGMTPGFPQPGGRHGDDGLKIGRNGMQPVLKFIDQAVENREAFFVWYAPFLPHTPHNPPERLLKKSQAPDRPVALAKYYAMCEWFDETCGELVGHLDEKKIRDETLIVYVTDNGWIQRTPQTEVPQGWRTSFAPRSKQSPNEGGTRTPIMLSWPGTIKPREFDDVVSSIDLVPTMLSAAEADVPKDLPGLNLLPTAIAGKRLKRDAIFGESFAHDVADLEDPTESLLYRWCIQGRWKLTYDGKVNRYKAVHLRSKGGPQLFDLLADPHENTNLARQHPERVAELAKKIAAWYPVGDRRTQDGL